jgi:hypothetical protein
MKIGRGNRSSRRKPAPAPLLSITKFTVLHCHGLLHSFPVVSLSSVVSQYAFITYFIHDACGGNVQVSTSYWPQVGEAPDDLSAVHRMYPFLKQHIMKKCGDITASILKLNAKWRWVVSFLLLLLYPRGGGQRYLLEKGLAGSRDCFGVALSIRLGFLSFGDLKT